MDKTLEILIDNPSRELIPGVYARHVLEALGDFEVRFDHQDVFNTGRTYDFFQRSRHACDVVLTPNYHVRRTRFLLSRALRQGARGIIIQHSEQFASPLFYNEKFNLDYLQSYKRQVACHIVWGEDFARKLVELAHVPPDNILIAGNPKLDIARRFGKLACRVTATNRPTILIASDFTLGDYSDAGWDWFKRTYSISTSIRLHDHFRVARSRTLDWLESAARQWPDVHFVMRTHPGENRRAYDGIRGISNVELSGGTPMAEDLARAHTVFCFTSSSLFEAVAMGKSVFNLAVNELPELCKPTYYDDLCWIGQDQMNSIVAEVAAGHPPKLDQELVERLSRHVWNPHGNTLLSNAIAIHEASHQAISGSGWDPRDAAMGRLYYTIPALKIGVIRLAHLLKQATGWKNPVYRAMRRRWDDRVERDDFVRPDMIAAAKEAAAEIIEPEEDDATTREYSLTPGPYGRYVEVRRVEQRKAG